MTVTESKGLKKGARVYWRGDAADSGVITQTSWDAVTITWNNGQVASVHHGAKFSERRQNSILCKRNIRGSPPQDRQGARPHHPGNAEGHCRRTDRIADWAYRFPNRSLPRVAPSG